MRQLQKTTLSNQNISADLLLATYTADGDRAMLIRICLDQVAGTGDYTAYFTLQQAGAGSAYKTHVATLAAAAGVTAILFPSILLSVENTDVVKVYVKGLGGDTATPDSDVRFYELSYLRPTTAGRTLDVASTGEAGLDLDNIKQATGATTLTNITVPTVTTLTGHTAQTGDNYARLGAPTGASVSADIAIIDAQTDKIPAVPAAVGSAMTLAADAIKASTFDEITAFPLIAEDRNDTQIGRVGKGMVV